MVVVPSLPGYHVRGDLTHYVGSRWYRAPELLGYGTNYNEKVDLWALGCCMYEFVKGKPLFPVRHHHERMSVMLTIYQFCAIFCQGDTEQDVLNQMIPYFAMFPQELTESLAERDLIVDVGGASADHRSLHAELGILKVYELYHSLYSLILMITFV